VFGAEVALVTRSAAARAEVAVLDRARKGSSAFIARCCSIQRDLKKGMRRSFGTGSQSGIFAH